MNYCSQCGATLSLKVPPGDSQARHVCDACGLVHYRNPRIITGCIPQWEDRVLLCRRAIQPRHGYWTLPAGFMENGETLEQGAMRETTEEAGAEVEIHALFAAFTLPHIDQVYMLFRAQLTALHFEPGTESLEVALFPEAEVPWDHLAFPAVRETLRLFFEDRRKGVFGVHVGSIRPEGARFGPYRASYLQD